MEKSSQKNELAKKEAKWQDRGFLASAGAIFVAVSIGCLWLINLPHVVQNDLKKNPGENQNAIPVDLHQVRGDLDQVMQDVGSRFEKIREQDKKESEAEALLARISINASSSLSTASTTGDIASTSSSTILKK